MIMYDCRFGTGIVIQPAVIGGLSLSVRGTTVNDNHEPAMKVYLSLQFMAATGSDRLFSQKITFHVKSSQDTLCTKIVEFKEMKACG